MKTPVAFIIFNRPGTTARVFEEIRKARPSVLLLVADGPRSGHASDAGLCAEARAIAERVDWDCEIRKNYSDMNLGCRRRVSSGLDWVFNEVEEAVILEDDCLPHSTFFQFCEELLQKYRNDNRIGHIGGVNFQFGRKRTPYSYYFSRYTHIWGWASWRRAWENYDVDIGLWPEVRDGKWLRGVLGKRHLVKYWTRIFDKVYQKGINTWDYQWTFRCWTEGRLAITPSVNLISNIGFDANATHTMNQSRFNNMRTEAMKYPLSHPAFMMRHFAADEYTERNHYFTRFRAFQLLHPLVRLFHGM